MANNVLRSDQGAFTPPEVRANDFLADLLPETILKGQEESGWNKVESDPDLGPNVLIQEIRLPNGPSMLLKVGSLEDKNALVLNPKKTDRDGDGTDEARIKKVTYVFMNGAQELEIVISDPNSVVPDNDTTIAFTTNGDKTIITKKGPDPMASNPDKVIAKVEGHLQKTGKGQIGEHTYNVIVAGELAEKIESFAKKLHDIFGKSDGAKNMAKVLMRLIVMGMEIKTQSMFNAAVGIRNENR